MIGGALAVLDSRTCNDGVASIGMIPLINYDIGRIKLNAAYPPKCGQYNEVDAFGVNISIPLQQWARESVQKR